MHRAVALLCVLLAGAAGESGFEITVVRLELPLDETHTIVVNASTEFILDFDNISDAEQRQWPRRVWAEAEGGDVARPLLLTHRQRAGAGTWQLPWAGTDEGGEGGAPGSQFHYELERTLCPDAAAELTHDWDDCGDAETNDDGGLSLHAATACARDVTLRVRVSLVRDFALRFLEPLNTSATAVAPRVYWYQWVSGEKRVQLEISSPDDLCATIAIQSYQCPVLQTLAQLDGPGLITMSMLRSAAAYVTRERFPRGFFVLAVVHEDDKVCGGPEGEDSGWLWEAAVYGRTELRVDPEPPPAKALTILIKPALSVEEYALASGVTLAVLVALYLAAAVPALLPRIPRLRRLAVLVAPRAVLAPVGDISIPDGARRQRRDSDATFDSSDMSDSDDEDQEVGAASRPRRDVSEGDANHQRSGSDRVAIITTPRGSEENARKRIDSSRYDIAKTRDILNDSSQTRRDYDDTSPQTGGSGDVMPPSRTDSGNNNAPSSADFVSAPQSRIDSANDADATLRPNTSDVTVMRTNGSQNVTANWVFGSDDINTSRTNGNSAENANTVVEAQVVSVDESQNRHAANVTNHTSHNESANEEIQATGPFGLPARLHVAALARRRQRVLTSRADRYLTTLATVAVFYALPVLQLVFAFQLVSNASGSLDICYYNFLCAHPAGVIADFNHVMSNAGYLLLGALFMLQVRRRRTQRRLHPRHQDYGLPTHYGLLSALGMGMIVVALLSASYHVCPNRLNFQFESSSKCLRSEKEDSEDDEI